MLSPRLRLPPLTAANPPVQRRSGDPDLPDAAGRRAGCRAALVGLACATVLSALGGSAQALPIGFTGVSTVRSQGFENENLLFYVPATNDHFGAALATGDFNGDGADDLATGIPGDDGLAGFEVADMGIVVVRYGIGGFGLDPGLADAVITKNYGGAPTQAAANDHFGSALAAGDWNGDGYDDLAVGSPGDSYCHPDACLGGVGAVYLFYGTSAGLNLAPTWPIGYVNYFPQYGWGLGNHFGSVLASGNFNGDLYDDLAIASPYYDYDNFLNLTDAGGVWVVHGGPSGIGSDGFFITPQDAQIPDAAEPLESFGYSLAVGNFNGDTHSIGNEVYPYDDLAIGVPSEDDVGAVLVIYGSNFSLLYGSSQYFSEFDLGTGAMQAGAHFGHTLVAADFDGDSVDDLALASPHQDVGSGGSIVDGGRVTIVYGDDPNGLDIAAIDAFNSYSFYGSSSVHSFDYFGTGLGAFRFDPHWDAVGSPIGRFSLVVGATGRDVFGDNRGGFTALRGMAPGLGETVYYENIGPDFGSAPDSAQTNQFFGGVFATGDFDGDGYDDLAIGDPNRNVGAVGGAGTELILYGSSFSHGFEGGSTSGWIPNP